VEAPAAAVAVTAAATAAAVTAAAVTAAVRNDIRALKPLVCNSFLALLMQNCAY
jgi:hypothetical protein